MATMLAASRPHERRLTGHNGWVGDNHELFARRAKALINEALDDTRVVAINGARQVGKSTLARLVASDRGNPVIQQLDLAVTLRAAREDPDGFVQHDDLMVIDEAQLAPELFRAIKATVDRDPRPGRFLLTGSARILALRDLPDALPGRMEITELWPLSQGEIDGTPDGFVDRVFAGELIRAHNSTLRRRDYYERVVRGGFPEAVFRSQRRRVAFFDGYLTTLIERDVRELSEIESRGDLRKLIALLAGRAGNLLVPHALANQSEIPRTTLRRYLELLSAVFLIKVIPAWTSGATGRAIGTPKLAFVDSGIACHLLKQDAHRLGDPTGAAGPMVENFVLMELARQITWSEERVWLHHYRTKDGVEVDAVMESADGRIVGIEVKSGLNVRREDLAGLRQLRDRLGSRFVAGYVLYAGEQTLPFGDRIRAVPLDALWRLGSPSVGEAGGAPGAGAGAGDA